MNRLLTLAMASACFTVLTHGASAAGNPLLIENVTLVNLDFIEQVELGAGGRLHMQMRDGPEIEVSRRQAKLFRARAT